MKFLKLLQTNRELFNYLSSYCQQYLSSYGTEASGNRCTETPQNHHINSKLTYHTITYKFTLTSPAV